jgi:hypothetical protein
MIQTEFNAENSIILFSAVNHNIKKALKYEIELFITPHPWLLLIHAQQNLQIWHKPFLSYAVNRQATAIAIASITFIEMDAHHANDDASASTYSYFRNP